MVLRDVLQTHSGVDPDIPDDRDRQKHRRFRHLYQPPRRYDTAEANRRRVSTSQITNNMAIV